MSVNGIGNLLGSYFLIRIKNYFFYNRLFKKQIIIHYPNILIKKITQLFIYFCSKTQRIKKDICNN